MFSPRGLLKDVPCPGGDSCQFQNCLYSCPRQRGKSTQPTNENQHQATREPDTKRRKLNSESHGKPTAGPARPPFGGTLPAQPPNPSTQSLPVGQASIKTATRPISPPSKKPVVEGSKKPIASPSSQRKPVAASPSAQKTQRPKESLNPRLIPSPPAGHGTRLALLKKLHEFMTKLNDQVLKSSDPKVKSLRLDKDELVRMALDEEEQFARNQPTVYSNVIKNRIMRYSKLSLDDWIKSRQEAQALRDGKLSATTPSVILDTGLTHKQELDMLKQLNPPRADIDKHGYVTQVPSDAEVEEARAGVESAGGWEVCERCGTRFQVFPDRREDGALASGGRCTHHWGRPVFVLKDPNEPRGPKKKTYACCQQETGSLGCSVVDTHIFKVEDRKRLAYVMQFKETPYNPNAPTDRAVSFDCEMAFTTFGLELIRLTAASWPDGAALLDILVRPKGPILDINTRWSGVTTEQFSTAPSLPPSPDAEMLAGQERLYIVPSPEEARERFFSLISSDTPLIGHGLENDLNAVRIVHPINRIMDTVFFFPHPRGLPFRYKLRLLVKEHLQRDIQMAGAAGHDSLEDARAAGDLVRFKVAQEWKKRGGLSAGDGGDTNKRPRQE